MDGSQMPLNPLFESSLEKWRAVSLYEMRLLAWFAADNLPFKKADSLTPVLKMSAPYSSQVRLKRTKVKRVIYDRMCSHECQTLADLLTRAHYSFIVDETTDKSLAKALVMIAKYKHHATLLVKEEFLGLVEVTDASSEGQKKLIQTYLKDSGVPVSSLIGIAYYNVYVNTGVHGGVGALFQEFLPQIFMLGCTSHSLALCASYATKFLPGGLELFLKDLINYVAGSPKGIA
ncbi:hypothetical protein QYM36_020120 [Artemia franciscana]|uniref:DUF4371 domain-containing protein n=1 Tax=Artemia franciscana TaxID=6661 RepID=A0AA88H0A3_ARTSF|nr:hypothetical protein QYM36_020120 [Artemia franciscana]